MASKPKRRMKYPPGTASAFNNPVSKALDNATPIAKAGSWLIDLKMSNHSAMTELLAGRANREHLRNVVACYNTTRSLMLAGFGEEHHQAILDAADAIEAIAKRHTMRGNYVLTGPEIKALNMLIELSDAQMEITSVGDIERAIAHARSEFYSGKCTRLPHRYIGDAAIE